MLTKFNVEVAINNELDEYLGYFKHESSHSENKFNGFTSKTLKIEDRQF